jgi:hypothetical protein
MQFLTTLTLLTLSATSAIASRTPTLELEPIVEGQLEAATTRLTSRDIGSRSGVLLW